MKKKPSAIGVLLFLTGLLLISALFVFSYNTYQQIVITEKDLDKAMEPVENKLQELKEDEEILTNAVDTKKETLNYLKEKAKKASQETTRERAEVPQEQSDTSIFSQESTQENFSSGNGHIVGIDPGHQGSSIDMSAQEPIGPGASETKAKASTGTQGSYTGIPEYQLNLDISLKLQDILEERGYEVVMTRTDNETAISNMERAQYVGQQGAEIYVRIHANGEDSHTSSGALAMAPSAENPYVSQLSPESVRLSQTILDSYCEATGFENLGVQYYDNMSGINWSTVPVTILEMGFMTNENDDRKMNDPTFQKKMVQGIADGIDAYFS